MTPDEIAKAISDGNVRVRLHSMSDKTETVGEGILVSYSNVPVVAIRLDDGQLMTWRHDLAERVEPTSHEQEITCNQCDGRLWMDAAGVVKCIRCDT